MIRAVVSLLTVLALTSCASGQVGSDFALHSDKKSIVVMGVLVSGAKLEHTFIVLSPGTIEQNVFKQSYWSTPAYRGAPTDGYLVAELDAGDTIGLTTMQVLTDDAVSHNASLGEGDQAMGSTLFTLHEGMKTLTFTVPNGKVIYVGDIHLNVSPTSGSDRPQMRISSSYDMKAAGNYVDAHYPQLKGRLEQSEGSVLPVTLDWHVKINPMTALARATVESEWTWD